MGTALRQTLTQLRRRWLESLLIAVAVALGVGVITVVLALQTSLTQLTAGFGDSVYARALTVQSKADDDSAFYSAARPAAVREVGRVDDEPVVFTPEDLAAAKAAAPSLAYAYLEEWRGLDYGEGNFVSVSSVTADFQEAAGLKVSAGSLLSPSDFEEGRRVMLLNPDTAAQLGLTGELVGQRVDFQENGEPAPYTVVGVLEPSDEASSYEAIAPWTPSPYDEGIFQLTFAVSEAGALRQAQAELRAFAERTWGDRVSVTSSLDGLAVFEAQQRTRMRLVAAFASLGLLVAALNLMSLMLGRVLRRTREIGVLRALGATRGAIRARFLLEALLLGVAGGLLGVAAGYGLFAAYGSFLSGLPEGAGLSLAFSPIAALSGFALALAASALFGLYPALVAARVRAVDALKEA